MPNDFYASTLSYRKNAVVHVKRESAGYALCGQGPNKNGWILHKSKMLTCKKCISAIEEYFIEMCPGKDENGVW